jgi:hypothetical protein
MANIFAITTTTENLTAEVNGAAKASVIFTVTNTTAKPVRAVARVQGLDQTQNDWMSIEGDPEKDFASGGTAQFVVNFNKPLPVLEAGRIEPEEKYPFRLTVASATRPDEDFTEGPKVTVTKPVREGKKKGGGVPWWIFLIIGIVALILVVGIIILGARSCHKPDVIPPTPTPVPATPTPVPTPDTRVPALVFEHADFSGRSQRFNEGTYRVDLNQFGNMGNDMASSIIVAQGYRARLCEHDGNPNGAGVCDEYGEGAYNVLRHNDNASYIKVWKVE